ncbi:MULTISPECIES: transcriptional regulator GcvA [unclassified Mesorhizobium]|uniref:transcriptional regulator GcvA n=2 Tax=Mesorhizobium TaxID=68287 RepID=UPI000FCC64D5|nr:MULTISPECIES: transcriptional regulator GcvA [unclassified Mesorhizobium]RUZ81881.1 transcriptional regulator GcvA [Mesorhizobium sp. M7A.F.Ca.US.003.02.2.1]RUX71762.1 transcriptional regulator GcvA [Mesorhizobium sp. M7A.F.Ca.US.005.03.1.1]RUY13776.1 transcriptional regulator GcvA [Mesorhizobium sp. M7A.F.Ca.US.005.03.2.1]RUY22954.1 transcriptional regulator GcvA [Mesorhizobium sp. M7A.F.Ca.US.001.04.2.1]RUY41020.1 transcriptional regulator GcvA [Mesorhizobium sp. M7A.F.Ca.US.001.04.1.1]
MARLLPGTRALRTLEAAARHLNFTRAADELGLTPAAVSHQIKEIEDQLGLVLFTRTSRTIRLTEAGTVLFDASADALDLLGRAVSRAQKLTRGTALLKVTLDAQFASKWLMRRVDDFRKRHTDIELRFDIAYEVRDFELDDIDVGIRFGAGKYPGLRTHRLFDNILIPVCSPSLLTSGPPLREPRDLFNHTLAHIEWSRQGVTWPNWRMWMAAAGINDFDDSRTVVFGNSTDAVQAALDGNAVALADFAMVANDLSQGRLVQPFELGLRVAPEFAYFLVYPENTADDPRIVAFREWMLEEVAKTRTTDKGQ